MADGSVMWYRMAPTGKCSDTDFIERNCAVFFYDVNGDKPPNTFGRDVFLYAMNPDNVYPIYSDNCNKTSIGWGCSGYIIKNSNMNYLH